MGNERWYAKGRTLGYADADGLCAGAPSMAEGRTQLAARSRTGIWAKLDDDRRRANRQQLDARNGVEEQWPLGSGSTTTRMDATGNGRPKHSQGAGMGNSGTAGAPKLGATWGKFEQSPKLDVGGGENAR